MQSVARGWVTFTRHRLLLGRSSRHYHTRECFGHWWKSLEAGHDLPQEWLANRSRQGGLWQLITAYRNHGHHKASLDPLGLKVTSVLPYPLSAEAYGLDSSDLSKLYDVEGLLFGFPRPTANLEEIVDYLERMYCGTLSLEVAHIGSNAEREWLTRRYEEHRHTEFGAERKKAMAEQLIKCQTFDRFLAKKFGTVKRYGAEGAESMMTFFDEVFSKCGKAGLQDMVLCMPHRGRLNLLTGLLSFSPQALFHKIQGNAEFAAGEPSTGDVISHLIASVDVELGDGSTVYVSMLPNPSHLEAVNPVALGKTRARQLTLKDGPYSQGPEPADPTPSSRVLSLQVHGDASFAAQGVVMESLVLANLPHFNVGGTVHLVVNNQLGFTTGEDHGRSSHHCSDVAKMIEAPVIHVNGDNPLDVARAAAIAMDYRCTFENDIIINMTCFRRWGHNELDNPSLTQPLMYKVIDSKTSVPDSFAQEIEDAGVVTREHLLEVADSYFNELNQMLKNSAEHSPNRNNLQKNWSSVQSATNQITVWDTGCPTDVLKWVGAKSVAVPENLLLNNRLQQSLISDRLRRIESGSDIDWATAEAMAIGSLLYQDFNVRLCGQDVGRGTFSHRHAMLVCQDSDSAHIPLNYLSPEQSSFLEVANSPLSEEAVLGFEYGFSVESPRHLAIWEAQFGDFFNGAQVIIDTFISCGEGPFPTFHRQCEALKSWEWAWGRVKWLLQSGLVMLLPHGYDGAGPDHSSCHVERFLQQCDSSESGHDGDNVNMQVAHPTTPAQYFHLLRRQMVRNFRKPLIIQSPKILLRLPAAVSTLTEMGPGSTFQPVLGDTWTDPKEVNRVILCSGKHFYALDAYRREKGLRNTALIRLELLCPFPSSYLHQELKKYSSAKEFIWSQEEPENMGPWTFIQPRFAKQLGYQLSLVSRVPYAASAVGVAKIHQQEAKQLLLDTFSGL